jgi:rhomboid protease GluP
VFISGAVLAGMNGRHMAFLSRGDAQALHLTGSVSGADLVNGHWWRLLTCCFVHFGFMHLFMNMYSLFVVGPFVEQLWGRYRYLAIYLLAGVGGSSVAMWHRPISNLAGASGALWGILGALAVWWVANRRFLPPQLFKAQMRQLLTVLIMNGIISFLPGISWTAHFGGAAVGAVVALLLHLHRFGTTPLRWVFLALTPLIPVICIGGLVRDRSRNAAWREIKQFDEVDVFQKLYLPRVEGIRVQFDQFLSGDFDDLQKLAQRRPGTVKAAKENILSMRGAANQLTEELEKTRFDSNLVSSASKAALHYLGQVIRLIDMIDDKLESNQEFDEAIDRQIDRTQGARNEWIKKLRDG